MTGSAAPLNDRGIDVCRGCLRQGLVSVLDLGDQPLANEMAHSQAAPDPAFPLHLMGCPDCGLGQVGEYVLPERIFGAEYPYLSSASTAGSPTRGRTRRRCVRRWTWPTTTS